MKMSRIYSLEGLQKNIVILEMIRKLIPTFFQFYSKETYEIILGIHKFYQNVNSKIKYDSSFDTRSIPVIYNEAIRFFNVFGPGIPNYSIPLRLMEDLNTGLFEADAPVLLNLVKNLVDRLDNFYIFEYLKDSTMYNMRKMDYFSYPVMRLLIKFKDEFINSSKLMKAHQYKAIFRLFGSESYNLLVNKIISKQDVSNLIQMSSEYILKIKREREIKDKSLSDLYKQKSKNIEELLDAMKNITMYYSDRISSEDKALIHQQQSDILRMISELVHTGYIPIDSLCRIYANSVKISEKTGKKLDVLSQNNAFTSVINATILHHFLNISPSLNIISYEQVRSSYFSSILKSKNNDFKARNIHATLNLIEQMPDTPIKIELFKKVISFVGKNNLRTLKADGIKDLFLMMDKYELRNKEVLINILPNLSTLFEENIKNIIHQDLDTLRQKINNFYSRDVKNFEHIRENVFSEEDKNLRHLVLKNYILLYQNKGRKLKNNSIEMYPNLQNEVSNFSSLSKMIAPIFEELEHGQILVSIKCLIYRIS